MKDAGDGASWDAFLDGSPFPWWEWRVPGNVVTASPRKLTMLGYDPAAFEGAGYEAYTALVHEEDRERTMDAMRRLLSGRSPLYRVDYRILAADGTYHWYLDRGAVTRRLDDGGPGTVRGLVLDLGEHLAGTRPAAELRELLRRAVPDTSERDAALTVCSACLRLRSGGTWLEATRELTSFLGLALSHGLCEDCLRRLYPDYADSLL